MKSINFRSDFSEKLLNISEPHLKSNLIHALHFHITTQPYYVRVLELQEFKEYVVSNLDWEMFMDFTKANILILN